MSEFVETTGGTPSPRRTRFRAGAAPAAHEEYAFACMKCGHGWEQAYDIEHFTDPAGKLHVFYYADGELVPSPLTRPSCLNCGADNVRILRAGQVSMVSEATERMYAIPVSEQWEQSGERPADERTADERTAGERTAAERPGGAREAAGAAGADEGSGSGATAETGAETDAAAGAGAEPESEPGHHWHLSDLLHPFQHRK